MIIESAAVAAQREADLLQVGEDALEFLETVVADDQLALAARAMPNADASAQAVAQIGLQALDIRFSDEDRAEIARLVDTYSAAWYRVVG